MQDQFHRQSSHSVGGDSDGELDTIRLAPPGMSQNTKRYGRLNRLPGTQRRLQTESEESEGEREAPKEEEQEDDEEEQGEDESVQGEDEGDQDGERREVEEDKGKGKGKGRETETQQNAAEDQESTSPPAPPVFERRRTRASTRTATAVSTASAASSATRATRLTRTRAAAKTSKQLGHKCGPQCKVYVLIPSLPADFGAEHEDALQSGSSALERPKPSSSVDIAGEVLADFKEDGPSEGAAEPPHEPIEEPLEEPLQEDGHAGIEEDLHDNEDDIMEDLDYVPPPADSPVPIELKTEGDEPPQHEDEEPMQGDDDKSLQGEDDLEPASRPQQAGEPSKRSNEHRRNGSHERPKRQSPERRWKRSPERTKKQFTKRSLKGSSDRPHKKDKKRSSKSKGKRTEVDSPRRRLKKRRRKERSDPDDEDDVDAQTDDEDVAAEIALDESDRFRTEARLRGRKESKFMANLRKLQGKRKAQLYPPKEDDSDSDSESSEEDDTTESDSDSSSSSHTSFFVVSDGDSDGPALPQEFSMKRESPEYKFKVVFQYLVLLVVRGPSVLPLKGDAQAYFGRQLRDVRMLMSGLKNSLGSPLWRPDFRDALETYPIWKQSNLDEMETFCEACNRHRQRCYKCVWLRGNPYDEETHNNLDEDHDSDYVVDDTDDARDLGDMGNFCLRRARAFHELAHWEHTMFLWVRRRYHCIRRAIAKQTNSHRRALSYDSLESEGSDTDGEIADRKRARKQSENLVEWILKSGRLPDDVYDADEITEWMDDRGWQRDCMKWMANVERNARTLDTEKQ